ncbi:MAG: thermonuclease family protein [Pseudolabrys sp.]
MKRFLPRPLTAFLSTAILPALLSSVMAQDPCKLTDIGTGTVASVRDGRTLLLADGGELRLAAIEVADESRDALQSLVGGRDLRLKQLSPERDRYGRIVAFAYVGNSEQSVQQALLEQGRARVSARTGSKACADLLLRTAAACGPTPILPLCGQKI